MARYRLSEPARADIAAVLKTSQTRFGSDARIRYRALLSAALRHIARDPLGPLTADRGDLAPGLRSLHIGHARNESTEAPVGDPVHAVFYRPAASGIVEIVRVLHERVEPRRHLPTSHHGRER